MACRGTYFDGRSSRGIPVLLRLEKGQIVLQAPGLERRESIARLRLEHPVGTEMPLLHWPDGGVVELGDDGPLAALFAHRPLTRFQRMLHGAERYPLGVVVALLLATVSTVVLLREGLPRLSGLVAAAVPRRTEQHLGQEALASLDGATFLPSRLPPARQQRVHDLLALIQPRDAAAPPLTLHLRDSPEVGANALCLPGGIVVVTDGLVQLATEAELLAVLAHEAGHAHHRHPLQILVRQQALGLATRFLSGGRTPVGSLGQELLSNSYSRAFERQADREAVATLRRLNRSPQALYSILNKLEKKQGLPELPSFLLTHPNSRERQAALEKSR